VLEAPLLDLLFLLLLDEPLKVMLVSPFLRLLDFHFLAECHTLVESLGPMLDLLGWWHQSGQISSLLGRGWPILEFPFDHFPLDFIIDFLLQVPHLEDETLLPSLLSSCLIESIVGSIQATLRPLLLVVRGNWFLVDLGEKQVLLGVLLANLRIPLAQHLLLLLHPILLQLLFHELYIILLLLFF